MKKFNVREFEAFCRSKPADEEYQATDAHKCALAQFGFRGVQCNNHDRIGISEAVFSAAVCNLSEGRTFGALADRLAKIEG